LPESIRKATLKVLSIIAVCMSIFHFATAGLGSLPSMEQRCIHVGFALTLIFLRSASKRDNNVFGYIWDMLLAILAVASCLYIYFNWIEMSIRVMYPKQMDIIIGTIIVAGVIIAARRMTGWALPIIASTFLLYAAFGDNLPFGFGHRHFTYSSIIARLTMDTEGIYGTVCGTSATYIFLFVLFGALLEYSGAAQFFVDLAMGLIGHKKGGSAKAAVVASGVFGMISGSPVANVMTIGSVTIPMMEKSGYTKRFAGAILSCSGTGGQIMPPIMGAAAFIIAETLGLPYVSVALAAFIPAALYYASIFFTIGFRSTYMGIKGLKKEDLPSAGKVFKKGFYMALPVLLLIFFMAVIRWSPLRSGFWAIVATIAVSWVNKETRMYPKNILAAFEKGAMSALSVSVTCATAGIMIGVLAQTALGIKLSSILVTAAGGNQLILLIMAAISGLIMGMGMTTTSVYIVLAVLVAPALVKMGVSVLAAHLFVFYFGILSAITPPVAPASLAAASLTESNPFKLGFEAWKIGLSGYIIPFMFIYNPAYLCEGSIFEISRAVVTGLIGVYALSASIEGYLKDNVNIAFRVILFAAALLLTGPGLMNNLIGFSAFMVIYMVQSKKHKSKVEVA
jgi:TRAP transporter 4TM/12TM fusion protein